MANCHIFWVLCIHSHRGRMGTRKYSLSKHYIQGDE